MKKQPAARAVPRLQQRPIGKLRPYDKNARTHTAEQVAQIAASIQEFGWTNPILVDEADGIIAGHGRHLAAKSMGLKKVPVLVLTGLSETQRRALVMADNKIALNAGWDEALLRVELEDLRDLGQDLGIIGFAPGELRDIFAASGNAPDPDKVPDVQTSPVSRLGDVWILVGHRLACGDSTDPKAVAALLGNAKPHLMVTDPPYGVEYDSVNARDTNRAHGAVLNDNRADWREAWALFPGDVAYVWHAGLRAREVVESLEATGFVMRAQIIWDKTRLIMSRGHYHFQHEPCWYAVRKGSTGHWSGDRKQSTVWAINHQRSETGHSTQKPVECMKRPIENNSKEGDAVYEPFSGSGTTIIAAEMTGRRCLAIELSPQYVDVAVRRWEEFSGNKALLEDGGQSFDEVAAARGVPAAA